MGASAKSRRERAAAAFAEFDAALREHDEAQWDYALALEGTDESSDAQETAARARTRLNAAINALRAIAAATSHKGVR